MTSVAETPDRAPFLVADVIEQDGLLLTPLRHDDADEMLTGLQDPELYVFTGSEPPSIDDLRRTYARQSVGASPDGSQAWLNWIVRAHGDPSGYVQATVVSQSGQMVAEIAWVIGIQWQGKGLATQSARFMCKCLQDNGVARFTASIHPHHAASMSVATKLGLQKTDLTADDGEIIWQMPSASARATPTFCA